MTGSPVLGREANFYPRSDARRLIVMSNRGPIEHYFDAKGLPVRRSSDGGVATVLNSVAASISTTWLAGARSDADRLVARSGNSLRISPSSRLRMVAPPEMADALHHEFCNTALWFLQHGMLDKLSRPDFERRAIYAWQMGYLPVNMAFADALVGEVGSSVDAVMLHDYHLYAAPLYLRSRYPRAFLQHFIHIPWPEPETWSRLPSSIVESICRGLLANDSVVMQTDVAVDNFIATCERFLPSAVIDSAGSGVTYRGHQARVWANPVSVDATALEEQLLTREAACLRASIARETGEQTIVRVDRLDPSKNIDLGFEAFALMLEEHPELRGRVRFLACLVPSRGDLPEYQEYTEGVLRQVDAINARFGDGAWTPIKVYHEQNRLQALVAMTMYDVLLVNSRADGQNLVSKEGVVLNERDGVLVLSNQAGSYQELGRGALSIDPLDIEATADALYDALTMPTFERKRRAATLRHAVLSHQAEDWLALLLHDMVRPLPGGQETLSNVSAATLSML